MCKNDVMVYLIEKDIILLFSLISCVYYSSRVDITDDDDEFCVMKNLPKKEKKIFFIFFLAIDDLIESREEATFILNLTFSFSSLKISRNDYHFIIR